MPPLFVVSYYYSIREIKVIMDLAAISLKNQKILIKTSKSQKMFTKTTKINLR